MINTICSRKFSPANNGKTGCRNIVGYMRRWKNNRVDEQRLKYMGADKPAAEWILLNRGKVKMSGSNKWITSYWDFPQDVFSDSFRLTHIDASSTEVTSVGFRHIKNVPYIKAASFANCKYVDDSALSHLHGSADTGSLKVLNLSNTSITPLALYQLAQLQSLKHLDISECRALAQLAAENPEVIEYLKDKLPKCTVVISSNKMLREKV